MCGRYLLTSPVEALVDLFEVQERLNLGPNYNAAPTQTLPLVRLKPGEERRELIMASWGLIPFWAKDRSFGSKAFNARSETVVEKPAFREAFKKRRCLVPADGFYEWKKADGSKQPYLIRVNGGRPFAFAGLWERWSPKDEEPVVSFTILTTTPNDAMVELHDRMPVILAREDHATWLQAPPEVAATLLRPCPDAWLDFTAVDPRVGNVRNNDESLIHPVAQQTTLL